MKSNLIRNGIVPLLSLIVVWHILLAPSFCEAQGANWTEVTNDAPWGVRGLFGGLAFNGQLWVIGGQTSQGQTNDVWSSSDGAAWTEATQAAPWTARNQFGAAVLNNQLWVMGG